MFKSYLKCGILLIFFVAAVSCNKRKIDENFVGSYLDEFTRDGYFYTDYKGNCGIVAPRTVPGGNHKSGSCKMDGITIVMTMDHEFADFPYPEFIGTKTVLKIDGHYLITSQGKRFVKRDSSSDKTKKAP